jgi:hypothetical protein
VERTVRKDGTISWDGKQFEAAFELVDKKIKLVIDPHTKTALRVESVFGDDLGSVTPLDKISNLNRKRHRPQKTTEAVLKRSINSVELAFQEHQKLFDIPLSEKSFDESQE